MALDSGYVEFYSMQCSSIGKSYVCSLCLRSSANLNYICRTYSAYVVMYLVVEFYPNGLVGFDLGLDVAEVVVLPLSTAKGFFVFFVLLLVFTPLLRLLLEPVVVVVGGFLGSGTTGPCLFGGGTG